MGAVFYSNEAFPSNQSCPGFRCLLHRGLLALRCTPLVMPAWLRAVSVCPSTGSPSSALSTARAVKSAASPGALPANNKRNFFPVVHQNSPKRIPRVVRRKKRQRRGIRRQSTRCDSSSRDNFRRDSRGRSSRMRMLRPEAAGRGRAILAQPREESIGLRPGGTEAPLPAEEPTLPAPRRPELAEPHF